MRNDLRVVGLECDDAGTLWGITGGFATRNPELITIDRTTGLATIIGPTGTAASSGAAPVIESLAIDRLGAGVGLVAGGPDFWRIDDQTGAATFVGSGPRTLWSLATLPLPEPTRAGQGLAVVLSLAGLCRLRPESRVG